MRYSLEPEYRKYVKGYGLLCFAKKLGDKGKSIISSAKTKKSYFKYTYKNGVQQN